MNLLPLEHSFLSYGNTDTTPLEFNATFNGTETSVQTRLNSLAILRDVIIARDGGNSENDDRYSWTVNVPSSTSQHVVHPKWRRREVQKLACSVPRGTEETGFGVSWEADSQYLEIDIRFDEEDMASILEGLDSIRNVTVKLVYLGQTMRSR